MTKTFTVLLEGPANAVTTNKDSNLVAVAGRNLFKIFAIDVAKGAFVEKVNLKSGKNRLTYSSNDVAWNPVDETILATGATNGHVVIWDLNRSFHPKASGVFRDHERTINTVCFHPTDVNLLISGSQDGTMKLFDLRMPEAVQTFNSSSESVRDLQFSPHSRGQGSFQICSVLENGNVQIWDSNKLSSPLFQFTAHNGPILSVDWHPAQSKCLATGGRDKTIKIWDLDQPQTQQQQANPTPAATNASASHTNLQYCIQTIASVARVRWRPSQRFEIASSSLVVDFTVSVWDIRRPFIPCATFTEHRDITRGFVWIDRQTLLSAGKDNTLCHHSFDEAVKPMQSANPVAVDISNPGDMVTAYRDDIIGHDRVHGAAAATAAVAVDKSPRTRMTMITSSSRSSKSVSLLHQQQQVSVAAQSPLLPVPSASAASSRHSSSSFYHNPSSSTVIATTAAAGSSAAGGNHPAPSSIASSLPSAPSPILSPPPPSVPVTSSSGLSFQETIHGSSGHSVTGFSQSSAGATTGSNIIHTLIINKNRLTNLFSHKSSSSQQQHHHQHQDRQLSYHSDSDPEELARQCSSSVMFMSNISSLSMDWFTESAKSYQLTGKSFDELCHINADVAYKLGRIAVCNAWRIVRERYASPRRLSTSVTAADDRHMDTTPDHDYSQHADGGGDHVDGDGRNQQMPLHYNFLSNNVIGPLRHVNGNQFDLPDRSREGSSSFSQQSPAPGSSAGSSCARSHLMTTGMMSDFYDQSDSDDSYVNIHPVDDFSHLHHGQPESCSQRRHILHHDHDQDETVAAVSGGDYFFADINDWSTCADSLTDASFFQMRDTMSTSPNETLINDLPEEAFIQRHDIPDYPVPLSFSSSPIMTSRNNGTSRALPANPATNGRDAHDNDSTSSAVSFTYVIEMLLSLSPSLHRFRARIQSDDHLVEYILRAFASEGDVQSCVSLLIVLGDRMKDVAVDEITQEKWFTAYIELLYRFQLWSVATQVISLSQIPNVNSLNQTSTNVNLCCGNCGKLNHGTGPFVCKNCNTQTCICCVCHQLVYGLYAWCEGCSHGGHLLHLKEWYDSHSTCPTGCGHECEYAASAM